MNNARTRPGAQTGSVLILSCGFLLVLIMVALLVFDAGRLVVVRTELQNAADSAALAGAACLARQSLAGSDTGCSIDRNDEVNWDRAESNALVQLGKNAADNAVISTTDGGHLIETGYWNLQQNMSSGGTMSTATGALAAYDTPSVKVTVVKDEGMNGGMIALFSAALFGGAQVPMRASAVAVMAAPGKVPANSLAPYVINQCLLGSYWDSITGEPRLATAAALNGVPQTLDQPWELRLGPDYLYPSGAAQCSSGQWTSFAGGANDVNAISSLIDHGNPEAISVGDGIQMFEAADATELANLFDALKQKYSSADLPLLVVESSSSILSGIASVAALAGFHVTEVNVADRYIQGHFIKNYILPGATGVGPLYYGVYTPPRLAL